MEAFLREVLPRILPMETSFEIYPSNGKADLVKHLEGRLRGYAHWLPTSWRIIVLIDRDDEDCKDLKRTLEEAATSAGLTSRATSHDGQWRVATRLAIEELEAWFFGEWEAVTEAFPGVDVNIPAQAGFRDPDAVRGGTWEALERVVQRAGHHLGGLRKIDAARAIGRFFDPARCRSQSFQVLVTALSD
jgi:hypothetical protein